MAVKSSKPDFDRVILHNLALSAAIGPEAWHRLDRPQPVVLDLSMQTNIELAGDTDDVLHTIHYGYLCKAVTKVVERQKPFLSIKEFADEVSKAALGPGGGKHLAELTVTLPKAVLLAAGLGLSTVRVVEKKGTDAEEMMVVSENVFVRDMKLACIIGVNPHERLEKQNVVLNLTFFDVQENVFTGYHVLLKKITDFVEQSSYETLEALATGIARVACLDGSIGTVTVSVHKPSALTFVGGSGVEITRSPDHFKKLS